MFMIMFTMCFTKAEGRVRTIPQNAGLNSATPSHPAALILGIPHHVPLSYTKCTIVPSMTTLQFKKKKEHKN
jgi:hypothetical protein